MHNMLDLLIPWEPISDLSDRYYMETLTDSVEGLEIILTNYNKKRTKKDCI